MDRFQHEIDLAAWKMGSPRRSSFNIMQMKSIPLFIDFRMRKASPCFEEKPIEPFSVDDKIYANKDQRTTEVKYRRRSSPPSSTPFVTFTVDQFDRAHIIAPRRYKRERMRRDWK